MLDGLWRGGIDHAAYADLSPISKQSTRILLVFLQNLLEIGPSGFEVFPRHVSGTLPFSSERPAVGFQVTVSLTKLCGGYYLLVIVDFY